MNKFFIVLLVPLLAHAVPSAHPANSEIAHQLSNSTVLDGVFTATQGRRGEQVYAQSCASCHGPELQGGETPAGDMAPSLAGSDFIVFWTELPVGTLFDRVKVSMPQDAPGQLSDTAYTDVLAYMLEANGYPTGEVELPADRTALDTIMIVARE